MGIRASLGLLIALSLLGTACKPPAEPDAAVGQGASGAAAGEPKTRPDKSDEPDPSAEPSERLAEQLRAGSVQLSAALSSIEEAMKEAEKLKGTLNPELSEGLAEIIDSINEAGEAIGDAAGDAPSLDDVKKNFSAADEDRLKRIEAGNDGRVALIGASNTAESLGEANAAFKQLAELLKVAASDVEDAIFALGGQLEEA